MSNKWNEHESSSPASMGSDESDSWSTTSNRQDLVCHGQVSPQFLFNVLYVSYFCNKCVIFLTRVNSTNVRYEGLRIEGIGRQMNSKVKSVKQGVYRK
jgi:hypothetical protein